MLEETQRTNPEPDWPSHASAAGQEWRATFDAIQDAVMILNPDLRIRQANTATALFLDLPVAAILGTQCHRLFHHRDCPAEACPALVSLRTRQHQEAEIFIEDKRLWLQVCADPILDGAGAVTGIVHSVRDITERKAARTALMESRTQLMALIESTRDLVWCVEPREFGLLLFNSGLKRYLSECRGLEIQPGMTPAQLVPAEVVETWCGYYRRAMSEGPFAVEYCTASPTHVLLLSFSPLMRGAEIFGIAVFGKDITEHRRAERELQHLHERLAHVERVSVLGQLTTALAHELNQPLGAILTNAEAAELLLQSQRPALEEVRSILADIRRDDQRAGEVIQRLRRLLKRRPLELGPLALEKVVEETMAMVRSQLAARQVRLETELAPGLPRVLGDWVHVEQVLLNLLMNAMEAMGGQAPSARRLLIRARRQGKGKVAVEVRDSGPGFSSEQLSRIFEPFLSSKPQGLGIGMAICRALVEAQGGTISAKNNSDGGATVRFVLPVAGPHTLPSL